MKRILIISTLTTFPFLAQAEIQFIPEVLLGQSINQMTAKATTNGGQESYKTTLNATSYGLRLKVNFSQLFSIELSKHYHGEVTDKHEFRYPICTDSPSSGGAVCLGKEQDYIIIGKIPVDTESLRLGIKGELEIYKDIFINGGIGIAHWQYNEYRPIELIQAGGYRVEEKSGNDPYFSLGSNYKVTDNLFVGLEYSLLSIKQSYSEYEDSHIKGTHHINDISLTASWMF